MYTVKVYGDDALSCSSICEWFTRFCDFRKSTECNSRTRQKVSAQTPEMIETVRDLMTSDSRLSVRLLADELVIHKEVILKFLTSY